MWIYFGFFATLVAAGLGFPAPEEIVIGGAGVLAGQAPPPSNVQATDVAALLAPAPDAGFPGGIPWAALSRGFPPTPDSIPVRWWILLPVCILGVVLADILLYTLGRRYGDHILEHRWLARFLPGDRRARIERNFQHYGFSILVFGRLVPGIRMPLFLTAGSMRLPLPRFLLADGLGAVVGNSLFFFLGYWLGNQFVALLNEAEKIKPILIVTGIGLLALYLVRQFLRHPVSTGDPKEVPIIGAQVASRLDTGEPSSNHQTPSSVPKESKLPAPGDST
jgi:membrane protein DedA with SNARE-associated domain